MGCRDDPASARGEANLSGYCNKKLDAIADKVLVESDVKKRDLPSLRKWFGHEPVSACRFNMRGPQMKGCAA